MHGGGKEERRRGRERLRMGGGRKLLVSFILLCIVRGGWILIGSFLWIVLAGSPHDPILRSLALDMERRGFIVFVAVNGIEDEQVVMSEGRSDIRPLNIDILDVSEIRYTLTPPVSMLIFYLTRPKALKPQSKSLTVTSPPPSTPSLARTLTASTSRV